MFSMNPADRRCPWANGGLFLLLLLAWPWMLPEESQAQSRTRRRDAGRNAQQGPGRKIEQQLRAMDRKVALAQARVQAAQGRLDAATSKFDSASKAAEAAEQASDQLAERVRVIEREIEASQPAHASFSHAAREFQRAQGVLAARKARILNSPVYRSKLEEAKLATNRAEALARIRQEALEGDAVYRVAFREYERARIALGHARQRILQSSQAWQDAAKAARRASGVAAEAKAEAKAAARSRVSANSALREAAKRASAAQQAAARIRSALRHLTAGESRGAGSNSKNKKR